MVKREKERKETVAWLERNEEAEGETGERKSDREGVRRRYREREEERESESARGEGCTRHTGRVASRHSKLGPWERGGSRGGSQFSTAFLCGNRCERGLSPDHAGLNGSLRRTGLLYTALSSKHAGYQRSSNSLNASSSGTQGNLLSPCRICACSVRRSTLDDLSDVSSSAVSQKENHDFYLVRVSLPGLPYLSRVIINRAFCDLFPKVIAASTSSLFNIRVQACTRVSGRQQYL